MPEYAPTLGALTIRDGTRADRDAVADLFERAEPEIPLTRAAFGDMWEWLHWGNPVRPSDVLVGADADGTLDGHVAMLPVMFRAGGEPLLAGWPCELMVDEHQRKSLLYPALVQKLLRLCTTHGYAFAYALINRPRVLKANIALGLRPLGEVPVWARPYRPSSIAREMLGGARGRAAALLAAPANVVCGMLGPRVPRGIALQEVTRFDTEIEPLFATTLHAAYRYVAERTAASLNWRFFGLPARGYRAFVARSGGRIAGYVAFRTMPMRAFTALGIADLWHDPAVPAAGTALLAAVDRAAREEQVDLAACLMPRGSPMASLLRRHWFFASPESFTLTVYQPRRDLPYGASTLADWHPTWYDHDYV